MRTIPQPPEAAAELEQGSCDWFDEHARLADWKDGPSVVLDLVDDLLERHGLEVVVWDMGEDNYQFQIVPRVQDEVKGES